MTVQTPLRPPSPDELEALIEEARRRTRRRRLLYGIGALLIVGAAAAAIGGYVGSGNDRGTRETRRSLPAWRRGLHRMLIAYDAPYHGKRWVWTVRGDGRDRRPIAVGYAPVPSPDSRLIAFTRHWRAPGGQVWVMSSNGRSQRLVGSSPWAEELVGGWAPDSRNLVFSDSHRLVLVDVGGRPRVLVRARQHPHQDIGSASFSPDGRRIVYEREDHHKSDNLWSYDIASGRVSQLTHDGKSSAPLWGPRGIAFSRHAGWRDRLSLLDPVSGRMTSLTGLRRVNILPIGWSTDGNRLLAVTPPMNNAYLWAVDVKSRRFRFIRLQALGLSRDGTAVLALQGCGELISSRGAQIEVLPFGGGAKPRVVIRGTCDARWSG